MINKFFLIFLLCFGLTGCSLFSDIHPKLNPQIKLDRQIQENNYGTISINTEDARGSTILGSRGKEGMSPAIEISENLAPMLQEKFEVIAKHHGYINTKESASKQLIIRLLVLNNNFIEHPMRFEGGYKTDIALEVKAKNHNKEYTHVFRYSKEKPTGVVAENESELQERLNLAFSELLLQIDKDDSLWLFLEK